MDALERSDIELAKNTTPEERLRQALEMMDLGLRLKRQALRRDHPDATEEELAKLYLAWLLEND